MGILLQRKEIPIGYEQKQYLDVLLSLVFMYKSKLILKCKIYLICDLNIKMYIFKKGCFQAPGLRPVLPVAEN